jgi:hypothetical protein
VSIPVKDVIEQERIELAKETALELGFANPRNVFSKPIALMSKGHKKLKRVKRPKRPALTIAKKPKITKKRKRKA